MSFLQRFLVVGDAEEVEEVGGGRHEEEDQEEGDVETNEARPPRVRRSRQVVPEIQCN